MLTVDKVKIYHRFDGDIDGYSRSRTVDQSGITDEDWRLIDELRQALFLIRSGRAALDFAVSVELRLASAAPDPAARKALRDLVR